MEEPNQQQVAEAEAARLKEAKEKSETTDYKEAELEVAKRQLGQAEHLILELKEKNDRLKAEAELNDGGEPADDDSVRKIVKQETAKVLAVVAETQARNLARTLSTNDDELELIMFNYKNAIIPTGDVEKDIRRAKLIANEGNMGKQLEQARRAALSQETRNRAASEGGQEQPLEEGAPILSEASKKLLSRAGLTWDLKRKGYVGKSGRFHSLAEINKTLQGADKSSDQQ